MIGSSKYIKIITVIIVVIVLVMSLTQIECYAVSDIERFQRPSKQPALNEYLRLRDEKTYNDPEDLILDYFGILKDASNMSGYCGGCGTVGLSEEPYPKAYNLLSSDLKEKITFDDYISSFSGAGHTTLIKMVPAFTPPGTPSNIKYFVVEFEIITAQKCSENEAHRPLPTYFAYYYGLITTENIPTEGWRIKAMDYFPEDFLCAPYHSWYWDSPLAVEIIFRGWHKLIDEIEKVDIQGSDITIVAKGKDNKYRFGALRLTNGEDIILHEYVWKNGNWEEVDYITEEQKFLKFSIWKIESMQTVT